MALADGEQRPLLRGWLHAITLFVAIPAGVLLIGRAEGTAANVGAAVYFASLVLLFGTSASYHRLARSPRARLIMRRLDHSMIFVLIAGTYTPLCLVVLPRAWGITMLAVVWTVAALGIVLKNVAFDRFRPLQYALYPALGWAAVIALPVMYNRLTGTQLFFLVAGGLLYSVGLPVLLTKRPNPWPRHFGYHEVWHVFTVVAAAAHFAMISLVVTNPA
jgi:hemolysin III